MIVVLDANVLFLAGYSRTSPVHDLLALGRAGACELVASGYAIEEARRNLAAKGPFGAVEALNAAVGFVSDDLVEGFAAGREKRPPRFEGK